MAPDAVGHSSVPLYAGPVRAIQDDCESRSPGYSAIGSGDTVRRDLHSRQRHACKKHVCPGACFSYRKVRIVRNLRFVNLGRFLRRSVIAFLEALRK